MARARQERREGGSAMGGRASAWSALAASLATLLCCVLPSLLVLLGFGTTVAAAVSAAPWLVVLSRQKVWVFLAAGATIAGSRIYLERVSPRVGPRGAACPTGLGRATRLLWWVSAVLWLAGLVVAFALGPVLARWTS